MTARIRRTAVPAAILCAIALVGCSSASRDEPSSTRADSGSSAPTQHPVADLATSCQKVVYPAWTKIAHEYGQYFQGQNRWDTPTYTALIEQYGEASGEGRALKRILGSSVVLDAVILHGDQWAGDAMVKQYLDAAVTAGCRTACPTASTLLAAVKVNRADASRVSAIVCSGDYAEASVSIGGNGTTQLFQKVAGAWSAIDRTGPCAQKMVPDEIFQVTCNSN